jgi:hypothetical protein
VVLGLGILTGLLTILQQASASVSLAVAITVVLPVVFTVSWILVRPALRSPLSLPITGRRRPENIRTRGPRPYSGSSVRLSSEHG